MLQKIIGRYNGYLDKLSIVASVACSIHCVVFPLLFTTLPFFDVELMENIYLELGTIAISLLIGGWAIWKGYRRHHRNKSILVLFIVGITAMLTSNFVDVERIEMALKFSGATLLVIAHICNQKQCSHCRIINSNSYNFLQMERLDEIKRCDTFNSST